MKITKVIPCGYCKGVLNAINLAKETRKNNPNSNIYILGMIVHNKHVVKELEDLGIVTLNTLEKTKEELIDSIKEGIVILTAHGTPSSIKNKIVEKGLTLVDATCKDVIKNEEIIKDYTKQGYQILYYGINNHPEAISALSISKNILLIDDNTILNNLKIDDNSILISQTTMSQSKTKEIYKKLLNINNNIKYMVGTCDATDARQNAIRKLIDCDILFIIGDKLSNNTNKLKDVALEEGINRIYLIDNKDEIDISKIKSSDNIYVTAGASTPTNLIDETIEYLKTIF